MDRNAGIEQGSRVDAAQVVKPCFAKAGQVSLAVLLSDQLSPSRKFRRAGFARGSPG
jgi:hypothetical protein